jgi:hypothetical protein
METGVNDKAIQAQAGFEEASPAYLLTLEDSVQKQFIKRTMLAPCSNLLPTLH